MRYRSNLRVLSFGLLSEARQLDLEHLPTHVFEDAANLNIRIHMHCSKITPCPLTVFDGKDCYDNQRGQVDQAGMRPC